MIALIVFINKIINECRDKRNNHSKATDKRLPIACEYKALIFSTTKERSTNPPISTYIPYTPSIPKDHQSISTRSSCTIAEGSLAFPSTTPNTASVSVLKP